jgi:TPR repeat protein
MRSRRAGFVVVVALLTVPLRGEKSPCRYEFFPAALGAEWKMRFTTNSTAIDKRQTGTTLVRDERVIDVGPDTFTEQIRTITEKARGFEGYTPDEKPKLHEVSYRCTDKGPVTLSEHATFEPEVPTAMAAGMTWETAYTMEQTGRVPTHYTVVGLEPVTVPAGTFEAYRVNFESTMNPREKSFTSKTTGTKWYVPNVGMVRWEEKRVDHVADLKKSGSTTMTVELLSYKIPSESEEKALAAGPSATDDPGELQKRCYGGKLADCSKLADLYRSGERIETDHRLALNLYDKACSGGYAGACTDLAVYYLWGNMVAKDTARAAELFRKACDADIATACANLGQRYETGDGVEKDVPRAMTLYKSSCDRNAPAGCFYLAVAMQEATLFEKACTGGHPEACSRLAAMTSDPARARQLSETACDRGWAPDCHRLAQTSSDLRRAAAFYSVGCKVGYAPSCTSLAAMVESGRGLQKDAPFAAKLYHQACQWDDGPACHRLGTLFEKGSGVRRDRDQARQHYQKACDAKVEEACSALTRLTK